MRRVLSVAVLTLLAACSSATGPDGRLRVATDQRVYALPAGDADGVTVSFTVQNTSDATMEVQPCGETATAMLERREAIGWTVVSSGVCPFILYTSPLRLAPGQTVSGTVFVERVPGTYRLRVPLAGETTGRVSTSPSFAVRWTDG